MGKLLEATLATMTHRQDKNKDFRFTLNRSVLPMAESLDKKKLKVKKQTKSMHIYS